MTFPLDLSVDVLSTRGSLLKFHAGPDGVALGSCSARCVSPKVVPADQWAHDFFRLRAHGDAAVTATPTRLSIGDGCTVRFAGPETLLLAGTRPLDLAAAQDVAWLWPAPGGDVSGAPRWGPLQFRLRPAAGTRVAVSPDPARVSSHGAAYRPTLTIDGDRQWTAALRIGPVPDAWDDSIDAMIDAADRVERECRVWLDRTPVVPDAYAATARRAWWLFWNLDVGPLGPAGRQTIFSTKGPLNGLWGWDNCFHALALARGDLHLAWQQLFVLLDHARPTGRLPDRIDDAGAYYSYTKPPLYGWCIDHLLDRYGAEANRPYLTAVYEPLAGATRWWTTARAPTGSGLSVYLHGNDSGWDNATTFDGGTPIVGADLAAYLVLQYRCLARVAALLGKAEDANAWRYQADRTRTALLTHCVREGRFVSPHAVHETADPGTSLIDRIPALLGPDLPPPLGDRLATDLALDGPFVGRHGPASERLDGPQFVENGYWRGEVWAPATVLIADGLRRLGRAADAAVLARRYCDTLVAHPGFHENHSALTGRGQFASNTLWTAAAFLELACGPTTRA